MISLPTQASEVIYRDWKALGAQYVLVGNMRAQWWSAAGAVRAVQRQHRAAGHDRQCWWWYRSTARHGSPYRRPVVREAHWRRGAFSTRLLYVTAERMGTNNTRYTLQRSDYDGARAVTLLQSREPILSPSFAPDGRRIAYVSFEQRRPRIFVQHIDTGRREQITNFEGLNGAPAWSPDGNRLAFVLSKDGNPEIYVMDMGSRQMRRITNRLRHRYRTLLGQGWSDSLLHLGSVRGVRRSTRPTSIAGQWSE